MQHLEVGGVVRPLVVVRRQKVKYLMGRFFSVYGKIKKEVKFLPSICKCQYSNYCHNYVAALHFVDTVALQLLHAAF